MAICDNSGNYHYVKDYLLCRHDDSLSDLADWKTGSRAVDVCSWSGFQDWWQRNFPLLKVRSSNNDIFTDCYIFKNMEKFSVL